jgi:hypothetical protein
VLLWCGLCMFPGTATHSWTALCQSLFPRARVCALVDPIHCYCMSEPLRLELVELFCPTSINMGFPAMEKYLRAMDWYHRHRHWEHFLCNRYTPRHLAVLAARFAPDELLHGSKTGKPPPSTIHLPNRRKIQTSLYDYFEPLPKRLRQHI